LVAYQLKDNTACPNCNIFADGIDQIQQIFGLRDMGDGTIRVQSWCKKCRSESNKGVATA